MIHRRRTLNPKLMSIIRIISSIVLFFVVCLLAASSIKIMTMVLLPITLVIILVRRTALRERISPVFLALLLYVVMCGISTFYAVSGKFALNDFLKVMGAFCVTVLLISTAPGKGESAGRWVASILAGFTATAALVSLDLISTRVISGAVIGILSLFTPDYSDMQGLVTGERIVSIFFNPNIFAGVTGIGVMLSLGLTMSSNSRKERLFHLTCLYITSLGFVMAFSLGALGMIALAFIVYLIIERKERRAELFLTMLWTLLLVAVSTAIISATSLDEWDGFNIIPLLCSVCGAALLCLMDFKVTPKAAGLLSGRGKRLLIISGVGVALIAVFAVLAFNLTGAIHLASGEGVSRSSYPDPGVYTLSVSSTADVNVTITSQNTQEAAMHTSTQLYEGTADGAEFTVPEDSRVVYFGFSATSDVTIESAAYTDGSVTKEVSLDYKLLPDFIARRFQGFLANQNFIQRLVFFQDGITLFKRSPIIGLGMGGFSNGIRSVQSFYYATEYAHNQYIQVLLETGIVGFVIYMGLLVISAIALWRKLRKPGASPMIPALGAAFVFIIGHSSVEMVFSLFSFPPIAYCTFALIGYFCQDALPFKKGERAFKNGTIIGSSAIMLGFSVLLALNIHAANIVGDTPTFDDLVSAVKIDVYEKTDYMLSYVVSTLSTEVDDDIRAQAEEYAEYLQGEDSNTIPYYLSLYYFNTGRMDLGFDMAEKYLNYTATSDDSWNSIFEILETFEEYYSGDEFLERARRIASMRDEWNDTHMGTITLNETSLAYIEKIMAE